MNETILLSLQIKKRQKCMIADHRRIQRGNFKIIGLGGATPEIRANSALVGAVGRSVQGKSIDTKELMVGAMNSPVKRGTPSEQMLLLIEYSVRCLVVWMLHTHNLDI